MVGAFTSEDIHLADIVSVYVTPPARGQGIAQRLMAALLDELAQSDTLETARLTVNQDQLPAVALYRRFGFTIIAQEEVLMGDGKLHTEDIMQKPLKR
jgi:ribosomal protein S18 acetylase RimI-like enzyme